MADADYDRDVFADDMQGRLFGPSSQSPLTMPGVRGRDHFRRLAERNPTGELDKVGDPVDTPEGELRASRLAQKLLEVIRNTNITASQPAHAAPMLWSQAVDLSATVAILAAVQSDYQTVLSYTVPPGLAVRISGYGVDVDGGYAYNGSLLWRLMVNGLAVPNLAGWGEHRGTIAIPRQTYFVAQENQRITFDVKRATLGGGTNNVSMAMVGWTWRLRKNLEGTKSSVTQF